MGLLEFVDYSQRTMSEIYESLKKVSSETLEQKLCEGHKCPDQNDERNNMSDKCKFYDQCQCNCDGADDKTECCECFRLHEHIEMLVDAINQGTKKFDYEKAPFLHDAMSKHFEFITGTNIDSILEGLDDE